jgi:transposase
MASRITVRQARVDQQSCFILATNELDEAPLPAPAVLDGYKGQASAERGFRFLKAPQLLASSLYLKKPERIMALLMIMTVCLRVYAALESRIRRALQEHGATFPDQKGQRVQHPNRPVGLPLLCGDSCALPPGARALRAQSDRRAPASAAAPGQAVCMVLPIKMHQN